MSNAGFIMTTSNSDEIIEILEEELNKRKSHPLCEQITLSMTKESILNIIKEYKSQKRCIGKLEKIGYYFDKTIQLLEKENEKQKAEIERLQEKYDRMKFNLESVLEERAKSEAIKEFAEKVNPVIEEIIEIMFDDNRSKCLIENCHKPSSIHCESEICIEENKTFWKDKIQNLVKEMEGGTDE